MTITILIEVEPQKRAWPLDVAEVRRAFCDAAVPPFYEVGRVTLIIGTLADVVATHAAAAPAERAVATTVIAASAGVLQ